MNGIFYLATVLIWGTTWYAIHLQVGSGVSFDFAVGYRFVLAGALLLPYLVYKKRHSMPLKNHFWAALQGIFLFGTNFGFIYYASRFMQSGFIAVIYSTIVIFNIINGAILFKSPVRLSAILGALLGITGVACIFLPTFINFKAHNAMATGFFFAISGTFLASMGNVISARNQKSGMDIMTTNAWGMLYGGLFMLFLSFLRGSVPTVELTPAFLGSLLYLSLFGSVIAFGCYLTLVGRIGLDRAAYAIVLTPVVALTLSTYLENFAWDSHTYVGVGIVILGNCVMLLPKRLFSRRPMLTVRPATPAQDF